ncbi:carbohydrate ABC transporter permease [Actinophytocola oryzae]|uniref:Carbohydrate ABC transporter membrane protein 1 (CUT1 family) n=1 Tax=Actinophytocola oryzae TaxID=502181 RepID=A0A4R7UXY0_9PSEU|nr:sugar ABC transporter permease [Actinophytocola oryzae]TDV41738.1 carbohydrate ABC transporter membrane protein 1 (CUT1 family) [Actinophytocola oryzae]
MTAVLTRPSTVDARPARRRVPRRWRHRLTVLSFMAPALVGIAVFFVYPLFAAIYFSFTRFDLLTVPQWVGFRNYVYLFAHDTLAHEAAWNTLWFVLILVPARMVGALLTAMLLTSLKRGGGFFRTVFYLPALAPPVAATIAFVFLFNPATGPVNGVLSWFGVDGPLWFDSPEWAKPSLVLLGTWAVGDLMVIFLAALLDVPKPLYEAASLDGASAWQRFRFVTLPSLSPVLLFAAVTGVIQTLQYFTQAAVAASVASGTATTGGGISSTFGYPEQSTLTYPLHLYVEGFRYYDMGYANALAVMLFVVAFAVTLLLLRRFRAFAGGGR